MDEPERRRQQRLEPDRPARRRLEGQPLAFLVLRRVHGREHVDQPLAERLDGGDPVGLGPERRL